jgi:hypothetical protein
MQYLKQASMPSVSICIGALRSPLLFCTISGAKVDGRTAGGLHFLGGGLR